MRRAIVVGGSLGGLFAAANLHRSGWDVTVLERSEGRLAGRGAGLGIHPGMLTGLLAAGARVDGAVGVPLSGRTAFARDGTITGELPMPQICTSWARLYSMLSDAFPEERIRRGAALASFDQDDTSVTAKLADGSSLRADVLVGADGIRSTVRRQLFPDTELQYAGYVGWRGMAPEAALSPAVHAAIFHRFAWQPLPGEHILGYPVPGTDDDLRPGHRFYSFVWYRPVAAGSRLRDMLTDASGRHYPEGIPPQAIRPDVVARFRGDAEALLCPAFGEVVRLTPEPLFQPIGDLESPAMAVGRVALLGDAAFTARPHIARGAIKAGHDAMELAASLAGGDVETGLRRYDAVRRPASMAVVEGSRALGAYIEGKGVRNPDPIGFMRENGGVDPDDRSDGGLFFRILHTAGYA